LEKIKIMEALTVPFNDIQLELLKLFTTGISNTELKELKQILVDYKFRRVTEMAERIRKERGWTAEDVENLSKEHHRTPYKAKEAYLKRQEKN
jgi:hypothetical protein